MAKTQTPGSAFALAGQIVKTPEHARRILTSAVIKQQHWLIPQARNVAAKLAKIQAGGAA
jgi:hypothetical protein